MRTFGGYSYPKGWPFQSEMVLSVFKNIDILYDMRRAGPWLPQWNSFSYYWFVYPSTFLIWTSPWLALVNKMLNTNKLCIWSKVYNSNASEQLLIEHNLCRYARALNKYSYLHKYNILLKFPLMCNQDLILLIIWILYWTINMNILPVLIKKTQKRTSVALGWANKQSIKSFLVAQFSWIVWVYWLQNCKKTFQKWIFSLASFDLKYIKEILKDTKEKSGNRIF